MTAGSKPVQSSIGHPGAAGSLAKFPGSKVPSKLYRVARTDRGLWWFASSGGGRFDLSAPRGTCYFGTDSLAAAREVARTQQVERSWVAERTLFEVHLEMDGKLANTTAIGAFTFGVTKELCATTDYGLTQAWAAAFDVAGFVGVRHELRHDNRATASGVSLFGPAGDPTADGATSPPPRHTVTERDFSAALVAAKITIFDPPSAKGLRIVAQ